MMVSHSQAQTVFVLSGGGNLGAVQVGMLRALLEVGIKPDGIVGTSIGALHGAFLAGHADLPGIDELAELWMSVHRRDVFPLNPRVFWRGAVGHQQFLFESLGLQRLLTRAQFGFERLEDAPIPTYVVATDLKTGEAVAITEGDIIDALMASSAIPGLFPSVSVEGREFIDGGVVANTPIPQAELLSPDEILVLPTYPAHATAAPRSAPVMIQRAEAMGASPAEQRALADASRRRRVRVLPVPARAADLSMFDFRSTRRLIDDSYTLTSWWLESNTCVGAAETDSLTVA